MERVCCISYEIIKRIKQTDYKFQINLFLQEKAEEVGKIMKGVGEEKKKTVLWNTNFQTFSKCTIGQL